jgi:hypothetical protein
MKKQEMQDLTQYFASVAHDSPDEKKDSVATISKEEMDLLESDLLEDLIDTVYLPKRLTILGAKYELDPEEVRELAKVVDNYNVKPKSIEKLLDGGIQVHEIESFVDLYRKVNGGIDLIGRQIEVFGNKESYDYFIPDASNCISYNNMLFVQKLINGTADQVEDAIYKIDLITQEEGGFGVGVTLHRMRELYEKSERYSGLSLEALTYVALNKISDFGED